MFGGSRETAVRDFNVLCSRLLNLALYFNPQYGAGSDINMCSENLSSTLKNNVNVLKLKLHQ
jgi:hypothetical protein